MTISLPPQMVKEVEKIRRVESRTSSELVREALRLYFQERIPEVIATKSELAAIRRGRAQIKRGEYVTLDQLIHDLERKRRERRPKVARKNPR